MASQAQTATNLRTNLDHLKNHVQYPATRADLVKACNDMADVPEADRTWFIKTIPEGTYRSPEDVVKALLAKV